MTFIDENIIQQLNAVNRMLIEFEDDHIANMKLITATCGQLIGATSALYNRMDDGLLCSLGQWNVPDGFATVDKPDGHICFDVIDKADDEIYLVENLQETKYAETDPNVRKYNLLTYMGHLVRCNGKPVGSLCVVFQRHYLPSDFDRFILGILAMALSREESMLELRKSKNQYYDLYEKLLKVNAEKDNFFSIIAHDLRSPFNGFLGLTYLLTEEFHNMSEAELMEISLTLRKSATNMYTLLENLLEWSRVQRGIIKFAPEPFVLFDLTARAIEPIVESARNKKISISLNFSDDISVFADLHMAETIIRNLVSNSVKFTHQGGHIIIDAIQKPDDIIQIKVQDNGIGMNDGLRNKLFNINEVVKKPGTDGEPSSGLGLIICKEFVDKHKGLIWVESEEGKGTSVIFTLPSPSLL
ncbi:MAG: HAMP domain-containing sensor histidine kinase [Bacteroidetes bacterium]|nr:HAMP domain-containing sensor histidine kinase [Bacteroidota bacterium]